MAGREPDDDVPRSSRTASTHRRSGPETGNYKPATSDSNTGDKFTNEEHGRYGYSLTTGTLAKGRWNLRVSLSDGTTHTTSIVVK